MAAKQFLVPGNHATVRGLAEPGATAELYLSGTTTPQNFYSDDALSVSLGSSITANGTGVFPIAYQDDATAFRLIIKDRNGVELTGGDIDPFYFNDSSSADAIAAAEAAEAAQAAAEAARDEVLDALATVGADAELSQVIQGLGIAWTGSLNFTMSAGSAYINGEIVDAIEQSITLDAADATHPRVDVLALNNSGTLVKIAGAPAANPSQPDIDPATQIFLKFVLVPAGGSAPAIDGDEVVYEEADGSGEWTGAVVSGTSIAVDSTSEPDSGTKCIAGTNSGNNAVGVVRLDKGSTISVDTLESMTIRFKSKTSNWGTGRLRLHFQNSSGQRVGSIISIQSGSFGLTTSNTSSYQTLTIPITQFNIPAGTGLQYLQIAGESGAAISWRMDNIKLKKSSTSTGGGTGNGITQTQADARYAQRANNLSDLSNAATARTNLGINSTNVKLTESLIIACSDETTALTTGTAKVTFRMPYAFTLSAVRASVTTAPTGSVLTVDINESGTTILSTKLTIDASEKTSTTAATAAVISDSSLADDAEITIDIDGVGSTIAGAGLKVYLIGTRT